jgi:hypothetical protein
MDPTEVTNLNFIGLAFMIAMGILTIALPRRSAVLPLLMTCCFITLGQRIDVVGLNFTLMRIAILFGWVRVFVHKEFSLRMNSIDKSMLWFAAASIVMYTLLIQTWDGFIGSLGPAYNAIGSYFLFRFLIRDLDENDIVLKALCFVMVPLALAMIIEKSTGRNLFSIFGGVPDITMVREGRLRAQGPFTHPILAGTFGATSIPFFVGLWLKPKAKRLATVGLVAALIVVITTASSGPLMALGTGILALCAWPLRKHMRAVRWLALFSLVALHLLMKAPIWFLIGRLSGIVGGTGWARSELIDQAIKNFGDWWLVGTTYTAHWCANNGLITLPDNPNMVDITNQFIVIGVSGGILPLILFIVLITLAFRAVGITVKRMAGRPFSDQFTVWGMGASLFAYVNSMLSVSLFDQSIVFWYVLLAMISSVSAASESALVTIKTSSK